MILNISQLLQYQFCPLSWYYKFINKRTTASGDALADGSYWHKLCEHWLKGISFLPPSANPTQDAMRAFVENGGLPKLPVSHVEVKLEMPLGRHTLVGILDGILPLSPSEFLSGVAAQPCPNCQGDGMHCFVGPCSNCTGSGKITVGPPYNPPIGPAYSLQWKTCAGGSDLERQCDAVRWSYHEMAYQALMEHNGIPCAGTYLGVYQKLSKKDRDAGVQPLTFHVLERPAEYVARVLREIELWADEMHTHLPLSDQGWPVIPNRRNCIQGFMRCQFWDSCYSGVPLSDERYVDSEDRYAEET